MDWGDVPSWVQAVGSIVALGVAIWLSWSSDKRARRLVYEERERVTAIVKSSLLGTFQRLKWGFETRKAAVDRLGFQAKASDVSSLRHGLCLDLVESALSRRVEAQQLEAADAVVAIEVFEALSHYKEQVETFARYLEAQEDRHMYFVNPNPEMRMSLDLVRASCEKAVSHFAIQEPGA